MIKSICIVLTISIVTIFTRLSPYMIFNKKVSPLLKYLGNVLPASIIAMLIVYCLKDINFTDAPYRFQIIISILVVVVLQIFKKNSLISIFCGTVIYMLLLKIV